MFFSLSLCPDCGAALPRGAKVCQACGCTDIKDWSKFFMLINVILLGIAFLLMLVFSF
jgi:hypothetical protein